MKLQHLFPFLLISLLLAPLAACGAADDDDDSAGDDDDSAGDDDDSAGDDDDSAGDDDDSAGDDDDSTEPPADADGDGYFSKDDCNDDDAAIHPGADELCDGTDHNCDGDSLAGAVDAPTWYADADGDGYGLEGSSEISCSQPHGYSAYLGDCDDTDPSYHPGAAEADCTDPGDYNCDGSVVYTDVDNDGEAACEDCDDHNSTVNSAAAEACNSIDDDCDGQTDEPGASGESTWYLDADGDGYGRTTLSQSACDQPLGYVGNASDCDDLNPGAYPGATEVCDGIDNNCDAQIDEGSAAPTPWYADADGDGYGNAAITTTACVAPFGSVANASDCDDLDASAFPGGTEVCDGADNNCDAQIDEGVVSTFYSDVDGDGYGDLGSPISACFLPGGASTNSNDCDDSQASAHPGGIEVCDGFDNDCAGGIDDNAVDALTTYTDADGDSYGAPGTGVTSCSSSSGVSNQLDCDDDPATGGNNYPGNIEVCDGGDNNCDSQTDEGLFGLGPSCGAGSCQAITDQLPSSPGGSYWLDPDGTGGEDAIEVVCDMNAEGLAWADVVATFHQSGADTNALRDRFFLISHSSFTLTAGPASGANSGTDGILLTIAGPSTHSEGFHLVATGFAHTQVRTEYRMQGSNDNNRCATGNWIPLCGPGYNGGYTAGYLPSCPSGVSCISGSSTNGQDVPISVTYANDTIDPATELLSWSHSDYGGGSSTGCARDSEIPTTDPATFFTRLLIR